MLAKELTLGTPGVLQKLDIESWSSVWARVPRRYSRRGVTRARTADSIPSAPIADPPMASRHFSRLVIGRPEPLFGTTSALSTTEVHMTDRRDGYLVRIEIKDDAGNVTGETDAISFKGLLAIAHDDALIKIASVLVQLPSKENEYTAIVYATVQPARVTFSATGDANRRT